jgi:allantoin racemase
MYRLNWGIKKMARRIKVVVPVSTDIWNKPAEKEFAKYANSETKIDIVNIKKGPVSIECCYDEAWSELFTIREVERAESEGYDGVIIYCFGDPGLDAAKEKLKIPVVGLCESSVHLACQLGRKFSIITVGPPGVATGLMYKNVEKYGVLDRCASITSLGIPVLELINKKRLLGNLLKESKRVVEEYRADTIILGCGSMLDIDKRISKELGIPVVVPAGASIKTCEALIDMGISQSKLFYLYPPKKERVL